MSGSNSTSTPTDLATPTPAPSPPSSTPEPTTPSSSSANSSPTAAPTTESTTSSLTPSPITTSSSIESTSSTLSTTSSIESTTSSEPPSTTSSTTPRPTPSVITSVITQTPTVPGQPTSTILITSTETSDPVPSETGSSTTSSAGSFGTAGLIEGGRNQSGGSGGLNGGGKIAVAVVVPIVAVALLVLAGLFLWRKRKQRKDAEELRRKEVEEYGYNPNNDPTLPAVGGVGSAGNDGPFEMREDGSSGYRGWGTTAVASSGRKASTTLSGPSAGGIGMAYSDTSPTQGAVSDTRSDNHLVDGRPLSTEAEALGAMGPAASQNRNGDINRGPSNASSSYSAANRSDGSGEVPGFGGTTYNNQYDTGNPYTETAYGSPPGRAEMSGQPVIRDVQARRNTRIENPSHFPQQSAGISQNF